MNAVFSGAVTCCGCGHVDTKPSWPFYCRGCGCIRSTPYSAPVEDYFGPPVSVYPSLLASAPSVPSCVDCGAKIDPEEGQYCEKCLRRHGLD